MVKQKLEERSNLWRSCIFFPITEPVINGKRERNWGKGMMVDRYILRKIVNKDFLGLSPGQKGGNTDVSVKARHSWETNSENNGN